MKYLLLGFLFTMQAIAMQAQQQFTFTASGKAISNNDTGFAAAQATIPRDSLTPKQSTFIKKELAARVQQAINNIQDDSLRWKLLYQNIWGVNTYNILLDEMKRFRQYLLSNNATIPAGTYNYVPDPTEIERNLFRASIYKIPADETGESYTARQLIFTNPLKHYLLLHLKETMEADGLQNKSMDIDYLNGWRRLEDTLITVDKALAEIKTQLQPCSPTAYKDYQPLISGINDLLSNASTDSVVRMLQRPFFKKWLWYNQGFLLMNPLSYTTADRRYPITEKISQLTEDDKKTLLNAAKEDSLLANLFTTRKIRNEVLTVVDDSKTDDETDFYYYDAAANYKCLNKSSLPKFKDTKKELGVIVYNVPAKETLKIKLDKSVTIPDKGNVVVNIEEGLSNASLASIITNAPAILTAFQKFGSALNGVQAANTGPLIPGLDIQKLSSLDLTSKVQMITAGGSEIEAGIENSKNIARSYMQSSRSNGFVSETYNFGDSTVITKSRLPQYSEFMYSPSLLEDNREASKKEYFVTINKRKIAATKVSEADKINFINASLIKDDSKECNSCNSLVEKCLIDTFIKIDRCYELNYEDSPKLRKGTDSLLERFKCYIQNIASYRNSLRNFETTLIQLKGRVKSTLSIIQRSLPPILTYDTSGYFFEEEQKDITPDYRTIVFTPALPEPPKKIVYEVYSSLPGKLIDGKDPADSNFVIRHKFNYAKRHIIDFSVGLAYTTTDYLVKSNSGNSLPQITEGDRFRPIAGMHIYPAGLLKVNNSAMPSLDRLSLFLGLSFKNALDNLYPAVSYDVVPGIRIMGGLHLYKDTRYTIANNVVVDQASAFRSSGGFISLNLEPSTVIKLIGLIK